LSGPARAAIHTFFSVFSVAFRDSRPCYENWDGHPLARAPSGAFSPMVVAARGQGDRVENACTADRLDQLISSGQAREIDDR